jgi:hypothetical protein
MKKTRTATSHNRSRRRIAGGELLHVIRAVQELALEVAELRHAKHVGPELEAKEQKLEQLRWRLAALARRLATDDVGAAA